MRRPNLVVPLLLSALLLAAYYFVRRNPIPFHESADVRERLFGSDLKVLEFAVVVSLIILGVRLFDYLAFDFFFQIRRREAAPNLLRQIISFVLYLGLIAYAAGEILNANVTGVLLGGTVLAAVLGLAMQDTLGNLFAGIAMHIEKTFHVGDVVRVKDIFGTVEWVSWRATRIRTPENNVVMVPNSVLAREAMEVFPSDNLNARLVRVTAGFEHPPARVISILERACHNLEHVATEIPALARVGEFGEYGTVYEVKYWTRQYQLRETIDAEVRRAIWYAFRRAGIPLPFPVRSIAPLRQAKIEGFSDQKLAERIANADFLAPLSDEERQVLVEGTMVEVFGRGETILSAGESGSSMFLIDEGLVSVRRSEDEGGGEIARLGAGQTFGEMALLTGEPRGATVIALTDVVAFEIGKRSLQPILKENPGLVESISRIVLDRKSNAPSRSEATDPHKTMLGRIANWFGL
ncbi:MAG: mechanosensitive ion channel family protein [Thermoanaerobaculia bacterium]